MLVIFHCFHHISKFQTAHKKHSKHVSWITSRIDKTSWHHCPTKVPFQIRSGDWNLTTWYGFLEANQLLHTSQLKGADLRASGYHAAIAPGVPIARGYESCYESYHLQDTSGFVSDPHVSDFRAESLIWHTWVPQFLTIPGCYLVVPFKLSRTFPVRRRVSNPQRRWLYFRVLLHPQQWNSGNSWRINAQIDAENPL